MIRRTLDWLEDEVRDIATALTLAVKERDTSHLVYALPTPLFRLATRKRRATRNA